MKTNYLKKYIISSYVLVWALIIFVAGTASLVFHAPTVVMWVVRNLIVWSPTYLLLMGWKYFRPDETRMGFVKRCFSAKVKLFPLICSFALTFGISVLSLFIFPLPRESRCYPILIWEQRHCRLAFFCPLLRALRGRNWDGVGL